MLYRIVVCDSNTFWYALHVHIWACLTPNSAVHLLFLRYRARFLHLSDIMLTSSHIPEYLVAAFAKRYQDEDDGYQKDGLVFINQSLIF